VVFVDVVMYEWIDPGSGSVSIATEAIGGWPERVLAPVGESTARIAELQPRRSQHRLIEIYREALKGRSDVGIAGVLARNPVQLRRLPPSGWTAALRHRDPMEGFDGRAPARWASDGDRLPPAAGARSLTTSIGLATASTIERRRFGWVTFNGEIYNHGSCSGIGASGPLVRHCSTPKLVHGWEQEAPPTIERHLCLRAHRHGPRRDGVGSRSGWVKPLYGRGRATWWG
jgi:hypothetical protein